jgi:hypothetical protein
LREAFSALREKEKKRKGKERKRKKKKGQMWKSKE